MNCAAGGASGPSRRDARGLLRCTNAAQTIPETRLVAKILADTRAERPSIGTYSCLRPRRGIGESIQFTSISRPGLKTSSKTLSPVLSSENGHGGANGESKANITAKKLERLNEEINRPRGTGPVADDLGGRVFSLGFAKTDCPRRWSRFRAVELSESGEEIGDKPYGARPAAR